MESKSLLVLRHASFDGGGSKPSCDASSKQSRAREEADSTRIAETAVNRFLTGAALITRRFGCVEALVVWLMAAPTVEVRAGDWPSWRGPEQTGMTRDAALATTWSLDGENLLWSVPEGGRTTPIIMDGRWYAITPVGQGTGIGSRERVICRDADTGRMIWEHRFNVFHTDIVENRVGWTAVVGDPETGNVYAHGTGGEFFCFGRDGRVVWKVSLTEELGRISGYGGRLHTPIVDEDRVIVSFLSSSWGNHARPLHRYVAFDKRTGAVIFWAAPGGKPLDTTYAVPAVAVIGGRRLLIAPNADGNVYAMLARTGEKVWSFRLSTRGLNSSVVVDGNRAYFAHSEENLDNTNMGRVVCVDASRTGDITDTGEVWRFDGCTVGYASPAIANGRLYVVDNSANLHCLDAATGNKFWDYNLGRVGKGSPVVTDKGMIYVGEQNGVFHILHDQGDECVSLDRETFAGDDGLVDELFGSPAVANSRVYFMTRYGSYCLGLKQHSSPTGDVPKPPAEKGVAGDKKGVRQVVPAEVTLAPGEQIRFTARRFDTNAVQAEPAQAQWTVKGVHGRIGDDGTFVADPDASFSAGLVEAEWDGGKAAARVRVSPRLPIEEDFSSMPTGSVPPGWVGVVKKTEIVERDGDQVLKKLAKKEFPSPPFMRLRSYITPPIKGGYTVACDLLGTPKGKRFRPDMGLINSRYRLVMMGMGRQKKLRVESWSPLPRLRRDVPFDWATGVWYRMKFEVRLDGREALVRGKVWPRDDTEPTDWTIEATDPYPNREGSPGLYGYSAGTTAKGDGPEIFYDNLKVIRND